MGCAARDLRGPRGPRPGLDPPGRRRERGGRGAVGTSAPGCDTARECTEPIDRTYDLAVDVAGDPSSAPKQTAKWGEYMLDFPCENVVDPRLRGRHGLPRLLPVTT